MRGRGAKVYLAGPYVARERLAGYSRELEQVGFDIRCRWIAETLEIGAGTIGAATDLDDVAAHRHAREDAEDVAACDILVAFTSEAAGGGGASGGRHVETGMALALNKTVVLVGEPENIFHRLSSVVRVTDWHDAVVWLSAYLVEAERIAPRAMAAS